MSSGNAEGREDEEEGDPEEKWEIARTEAASLVARNPTSASAHGEAGLILDRSGQPREAITYLRHAVKLAPKGAVYYDMLGLVYRNAATSINRYLNGKNRRRLETQAAERVPGGDDPCYKREVATCFELKYYTNAQLHIAEEDFIRRVQADDSDEHGFGLLAQLYRLGPGRTERIRFQETKNPYVSGSPKEHPPLADVQMAPGAKLGASGGFAAGGIH